MNAVEEWIVTADGNDGLIKEGLKRLEATVTEQDVAIPAFRVDVQGAAKDVAAVMDRVAGQTGGNQSVSPGASHDDLCNVQAQGEESYRRLGIAQGHKDRGDETAGDAGHGDDQRRHR